MKYIMMQEKKKGASDIFTTEFDDRQEAIKSAKNQWDYLTYREKKQNRVYVLESINPDEEAENHFDGNIIYECEVIA